MGNRPDRSDRLAFDVERNEETLLDRREYR
jgi:hypothetical protein